MTDKKQEASSRYRKSLDWQAFLGRVDVARRAKGMSQRDLAGALGIREASVSEWLNQKRVPMGDVLLRFPEALGVSGHWLLTGEGQIRAPDGSGAQGPNLKEWAFDEMFAFMTEVNESSSGSSSADECEPSGPAEGQTAVHETVERALGDVAQQSKAPDREANGTAHPGERRTG